MSSGSYLQIIQGDSYTFTANVCVDNVAQNITGSAVYFFGVGDVWPDFDSETIINVSTNTGGVSINNSNVTVTLNAAYTNALPLTNVGKWFLRTRTTGNNVYTLDRGNFCVVAGLPQI